VLLPADELGNLLRAHGYLRVERPPQLWDVDTTELEPFVRLMGELLAAGLGRVGATLDTLVLSVANVHAAPESADPLPAGDLVSVSVAGPGAWSDATWRAGQDEQFVNEYLGAAAQAAGAVYAYSRRLADGTGSISVLYRRWVS
jgi:hypothetical protein